jgi:hypothetical protein
MSDIKVNVKVTNKINVSSAFNVVNDRIKSLIVSVDGVDNYTITAGSEDAGNYTGETITNASGVSYEINGSPVSLPFTLNSGDSLKVTFLSPTYPAKVKIDGNY